MARGNLAIVQTVRSWRLGPWQGYAAAAGIYLIATGAAYVAQPGVRDALLILYLPAIVLGTLVGGGYAGLLVAAAGGFTLWLFLQPLGGAQDVLTFVLYVDAAALLLLVVDAWNRAFDELTRERDRANLLFKELQHRTANNLMFVSGFLNMQRRHVLSDPAKAAEYLDQAAHRLNSFSQIHRQLYQPVMGRAALETLFREVCQHLLAATGANHVSPALQIEDAELDFQETLVLGLLLAEIVTNALKYAFPPGQSGRILVRLASEGNDYVFEVRDNGRGLASTSSARNEGSGYSIMKMLAAQLRGSVDWISDGGLITRVVFPRKAKG